MDKKESDPPTPPDDKKDDAGKDDSSKKDDSKNKGKKNDNDVETKNGATETELSLADLSRSSHGFMPTIVTDPSSEIRSNRVVMPVGTAFNHSVFKWLRNSEFSIPNILFFLVEGLEAIPQFSDPSPSVSPALVATIVSASIRESLINNRMAEIDVIATALATEHGLPEDQILNVVAMAAAVKEDLVKKGQTALFASLFTEAKGVDNLVGQLSTLPRAPWRLYEMVHKTFGVAYSSLLRGDKLELISQQIDELLANEQYAQFSSFVKNLTTFPVSRRLMTLYQYVSKFETRGEVNRELLPLLSAVQPTKEQTRSVKTYGALFGMGIMDKDTAVLSDVEQLKYFTVSDAFGDIHIGDIVRSLNDFDRQVFTLNFFETDVEAAMQYKVIAGNAIGIPMLNYAGRNLFKDKRFEVLLGLTLLKNISAGRLSTINSQVKALIDAYKGTESNSVIKSNLAMHFQTMAYILDTFSGMRMLFADILADYQNLSLYVPQNAVQDSVSGKGDDNAATRGAYKNAKTGFIPVNVFESWMEARDQMMQIISAAETNQSTAAIMFQPSSILNQPSLLTFGYSDLLHRLIQQPNHRITSSGLEYVMPLPEYINGKGAFYGTSSPGIIEGTSDLDKANFSRLSAGTTQHHLVHIYVEEYKGGILDFENLFRFVPLATPQRFKAIGSILSGLGAGKLSIFTVVATLMEAAFSGIQRDFGLASYRASLLRAGGQKLETITIDSGEVVQAIRSRLGGSLVKALTYGTGKNKTIAAIEEGPLFDLGSANLVFIYESMDQLRIEKGGLATTASHVLAPMFAVHPSPLVRGSSLRTLVEPVPDRVKKLVESTSSFFASTFTITPKKKTKTAAEELNPTSTSIIELDSVDVEVTTDKIE